MSRNTYRIGQIVPSSNTTMETEIPAMLRARESIRTERFTFHSSRMRMRNVTPEELEAMNREGQRCVAELADARMDLISTACLVAIMASGLGAHRETATIDRNAVPGPHFFRYLRRDNLQLRLFLRCTNPKYFANILN